jgi:rSAM/selenodomain-associated transferase 2
MPPATKDCSPPRVSVIIPAFHEADTIAARLQDLQATRREGAEIIVVDGGGDGDETAARAAPLCDFVMRAPRGRSRQMNAGARAATGDILIFLHADTLLPPEAQTCMREGLAKSGRAWGRFDLAIEGRSRILPVIAWFMNARSRVTGVATGDQAIFVTRAAFEAVGGFPDIALMEDVALSSALKRLSRPVCLRQKVTTSGRRWDQHGALRVILKMWSLRWRYFFGANPNDLARAYGYKGFDEK